MRPATSTATYSNHNFYHHHPLPLLPLTRLQIDLLVLISGSSNVRHTNQIELLGNTNLTDNVDLLA